jgi:hypothetical protein
MVCSFVHVLFSRSYDLTTFGEVLRTASFWAVTWRVAVIPYRLFGTPTRPIFKNEQSKNPFFLEYFTLEDGTDRLSRNVGKLPLLSV